MMEFVQKRLVHPILQLLSQGITPEKIALSLAFGIMLGVFPVLGTTTLLCLVAALVFRLNLAAVQLVNFLVYPLWFALLIPFVRVGKRLFGVPPLAMTGSQIPALAHANFLHSMSVLWLIALRAAAAWMLVGPPAIIALYAILVPIVCRMLVFLFVLAHMWTGILRLHEVAGGREPFSGQQNFLLLLMMRTTNFYSWGPSG